MRKTFIELFCAVGFMFFIANSAWSLEALKDSSMRDIKASSSEFVKIGAASPTIIFRDEHEVGAYSSDSVSDSACHNDEVYNRFENCDWTRLTGQHKEIYRSSLARSLNQISDNYVAPKKDGEMHHGTIHLCVDSDGTIETVTLKASSEHQELAYAFAKALIKTQKLHMPDNQCVVDAFYYLGMKLSFDEQDMAD